MKWRLIFPTVAVILFYRSDFIHCTQTEQSVRDTAIVRNVVNDAFLLLGK